MRCKVTYCVGRRPGWFTHMLMGTLHTDEAGLRIDGPAPCQATFSEIQWLGVTSQPGLYCIAVGSSPPVFITPVVLSLFGFLQVLHPPLNEKVYAELYERVGGLRRCASCGCGGRPSAFPCPQCAAGGRVRGRSRFLLRFLVVGMLAVLLGLYWDSYFFLSRRGMREAREYHMKGFLYVPFDEVLRTRSLSRHYALMRLYAPLNLLDQTLFGAPGPVRDIMWGLSK